MDPLEVGLKSVMSIVKVMFSAVRFLARLGFLWLMIGYAGDWMFYQFNVQYHPEEAQPFVHSIWMLVAWGGTILHFLNLILGKIKGRKVNVVFDLLSKITHGKVTEQGVKTKLRSYSEPIGIIFGREKGRYFLQDEDAPNSVGIFGTPGSGKTQGAFIPTLLSYGSKSLSKPLNEQPSVFVVDVKGELLQSSYKYRSGTMKRQIKYLSFGERIIPDLPPCRYDPFAIMDFVENDIQGVTEIANALIPMAKNESNPYFTNQARTLLAGLLYSIYKFPDKISFAEALEMICSVEVRKLIETFCIGRGTEANPDNKKAWMLLSSFYKQASQDDEAESFANVRDTMLAPIRLIATNDNIINAFDTSSGSVLRPQDLIEGDVYICIKEQYLDADQPNILNLIVNQFLSYFSRFENNTNKRILFMLDEFPRLGELKKVTEGVNLFRSRGIRFMIAAQSIDQIKEKYGQDHFGVLMDGIGTTLVLRAVGTSAEYFSRRVGKYDKIVKSKNSGVSSQTMQLGSGASSGSSESEQERDVFRPSFFENELASKGKLMILAPDGYKVADVAFAYNDPVFSKRM